MNFPKTYVHRDDRTAQVVVATAEQEADLPKEYVLLAAPAAPGTGASPDLAAQITKLAADRAELEDQRKQMDAGIDEFANHVRDESDKLAKMRDQLDLDRATLDQHTASLNEQMEALARERAEFEAQRAAAAGTADIGGDAGADKATAEGAGTGETPAPAATPAKRTRTKAEG